ncbi:unnamed protein product [Arabidopsis halleri]
MSHRLATPTGEVASPSSVTGVPLGWLGEATVGNGLEVGSVSLKSRTNSFKRDDTTTHLNSLKITTEQSLSFNSWEVPKETKTNSDFDVLETKKSTPNIVNGRNCEIIQIKKPTVTLPEPFVFFSPRPVTELDAAATTWKILEGDALDLSYVSFFEEEKHETLFRNGHELENELLRKGLSKDEKAHKLALQHWLEVIDPRHRYGHNLHFYYDVWSASKSSHPFFYRLDVGDDKDVNLEKHLRSVLQKQCIRYLGLMEREKHMK